MLIRGIGDRVSWHKKYPQDETMARLEVALYSAGRPVSLEELMKATGSGSKEITLRTVRDLVQRTRGTFKALEIR